MALPSALIESLQTATGFEQEAFEQVHASGEQVVSIRINPTKPVSLNQLTIQENIPWCSNGRYLTARPFFTFDPLLHAGAYYVQEASSMFLWQAITQVVPESTGKKVLDLCAAPGGKTTLLASYFTDGLVVANEVIKNRAAILVENCTKWGSAPLVVTNNDPAHFQSLPGFFDVMVVDAPCSGSGLFRKDPNAMQEWSEESVTLCNQRQQRILADALPCLKEGGILIYATCSYSIEEDETICDWLVDSMYMKSISLSIDPNWGIVSTQSTNSQAAGYRFYPNLVKGEGFFLAVFQKLGSTENKRYKANAIPMASKTEQQQIIDTIPLISGLSFFNQSGAIRAIPEEWMTDIGILASQLYIKKAGIELASLKGKDVVPSHELALSPILLAGYPVIELPLNEALQYLRRKEFVFSGINGWNLVQFGGLSMGWAKVLPNRINNYYPAEWRILKD